MNKKNPKPFRTSALKINFDISKINEEAICHPAPADSDVKSNGYFVGSVEIQLKWCTADTPKAAKCNVSSEGPL